MIKYFRTMTDSKHPGVLLLFFLLTICVSLMAQEKKESAFIGDFLKTYDASTDKVSKLAEAIPADKFSWRPAEGVRSVQEAILHVAGGNYFLGSFLGAKVPEGVDLMTFDKAEGTKEMVLAKLKAALDQTRGFISSMDANSLDEEVDFMGNEMTKRHVVLIIGDHIAEHLGQIIAYGRMNGVVPPWSR